MKPELAMWIVEFPSGAKVKVRGIVEETAENVRERVARTWAPVDVSECGITRAPTWREIKERRAKERELRERGVSRPARS